MSTTGARAITGAVAATAAIIAAVFGIEGGYVNHPSDPGGATNHGISERVARDHGYRGDMRELTRDQAAAIYHTDYIVKPGFAPLIEISPAVAEEVIDSAVNTGPANPSRWLQISLNALNRRGRDYANIAVDGRVGPATLSAYRSLQRVRGAAQACELAVKLLDAQQASYYLRLAADDSRYEDFMAGWSLNRIGNVDLGRCRP